ncbi:MAG TPA: glycosyltransferase family 2 protein [Thermoanaerobaculia bacterium]|jgi:cellulose synthase/poly-beta-1,6-N-acetylglucosamine synthase-like glycosyltransferase
MAAVLLALALATLLAHVATAVQILRGNRTIRFLKALPPLGGPLPRVSIIIPARNEERNLEEALRSVLALDYDNLEIDVVEDRSTDRTGEILDRLAATDPRLRVVRVRALPPGWLGKNHALWLGAEKATGEFLLFTDADVVLEPAILRRAVGAMVAEGLDHLTASPEIDRPSVLFEMFIGAFSLLFALYTRPWKVKDPASPHYVGIGAFNLVRASAYHAVGGHRAIAMRPDDDLKLGKILKLNGCRQELVFGQGALRVEWYASVRELVRGLMKNAFSGVDYRVWVVVVSTLIQLTLLVWPFLAIVVTSGATRWLNLASVLVLVGLCWINAPLAGVRRWHGVGFALATLLFLYILWRAMILTLWNGGIDWRGTHYPLAELRANKV